MKNMFLIAGGVWGFISDYAYSNMPTFSNVLVLFPSNTVMALAEAFNAQGIPSIGYTLLTIGLGGLVGLLAGMLLNKK